MSSTVVPTVWLTLALLATSSGLVRAQEAAAAPRAAISRPAELQRDVDFWIRVYSEVSTNDGFLHDEWDLSIVYAKMQFPPDTAPRTRSDSVDETRDRYIAVLRQLAAVLAVRAAGTATEDPLSADEQRVLALWGDKATPERLLEATRSIRFQLGQSDRFRAGLVRSGAWETHIAEAFANLGLPPELAALPHVESSFNPAAYSKVGAAGLWQFMRATGRRYLRVDDAVDERMDPFRATEAAAQLLSYNYRVLGTWPLALTAYNHGAAGMRRAKEAMGTDDIVTIARRFRGPTFGFASRNFYPSFLAALTIDQNPDRYFSGIERAPEARFTEVAVPGYVRLPTLERVIGLQRSTLRELNPGLRPAVFDGSRLVPRGYRLRLPLSATSWSSDLLASRLGAGELYAAQIASRSHTLRRGETLAAVARRYALTTRALAELNGIELGRPLKRGRTLRLPDTRPPLLASAAATPAAVTPAAAAVVDAGPAPGAAATVPASARSRTAAVAGAATGPGLTPAGAASVSSGPTVYVVRGGDTLVAIAKRFGLTQSELMKINRLRDADFVFEGQRLRLSAAAGMLAANESVAQDDAAQDNAARDNEESAVAEPRVASVATPTAGMPSQTGAAALASRSGPATRRALRPSAILTAQVVAPAPKAIEPVSKAQAEAQSPAVGPADATAPPAADAMDLNVARDGTIQVIAEETLGHYADWLQVSAARIRELNRMKYGQAVLLGRQLRLDFAKVTRADFEQRRRDFHNTLQAKFFATRRISGTEVYIVRRGDTLWSITQRYDGVPVWLLQQYNPDLDFGELRAGSQLVVPRLDDGVTGPATVSRR